MKRKKERSNKINTAALPDIIFMLLFFFMVTTVMQTQTISSLELPAAYGVTPKSDGTPSELVISLYSQNGEDYIKVNSQTQNIDLQKKLLITEAQHIKSQGVYLEKAILYIDQDIVMSTVNRIKETLQELEIYTVNFIHDYEAK